MPSGVYTRTAAHRAIMSAAKTGTTLSPEHCAAISTALRGHPVTAETRAALKATSTGSRNGSFIHGLHGTPAHISWQRMKQRCTDPKQSNYASYGGRGITVCERWQSFKNFLEDMGPRPAGKTLDRIDPDGNYEPGNCRWATSLEQTHNRRGRRS